MNAYEAKETLPNVKVRYSGHNYTATTAGRYNNFATLHWEVGGSLMTTEASWAAVARAATTGKPIIL